MHSLPSGRNELAGLHEFTVTETRTPLTFKDIEVNQVFWEPFSRKKYKKLSDDQAEMLNPDYEYERFCTVIDADVPVEL